MVVPRPSRPPESERRQLDPESHPQRRRQEDAPDQLSVLSACHHVSHDVCSRKTAETYRYTQARGHSNQTPPPYCGGGVCVSQ
uniref:Uncharacterized protein n=1 Tax=Amphilophus citrinellus TaxID=61819 RepID=A0A3Q0QWC8_AMPCI